MYGPSKPPRSVSDDKRVRFSVVSVIVAVLTTVLIGRPASRQDGRAAQVDRLFASGNKPDSPGCAAAVVKDGGIVHSRGYGMADLEHRVPITPTSVFYVGSLSKQFTAMAIGLLAQQGALSLDEDIHKYLPELPTYGKTVTIRNLIHHTSGLPEYMPLFARAGRRPEEPFTNRDVLEIVSHEPQLTSDPGERFSYSNNGYTFLAIIAERAGHLRFAEFAETAIFAPLGMRDSFFYSDPARTINHRAFAFEPSPNGGFRLGPPVPPRVGAGGLFTTVEDLTRWDRNFYDAKVGGEVLVRQLTTPGALANGRPLEYGFGLEVRTYRGHPVVEHGGDFVGYHAYMARFSQQHLSVILLCNGSDINQVPLAHAVADIYLQSP